jgi:ABC-type branched-subunit amino acid transport system ATPase component
VIELKGLSKSFGGLQAVNSLDLTVESGEIVGLIGPNGSGKSTTVNLICGIHNPTSGQILFQGQDLAKLPTHTRLRAGVARTFQNIRLFDQLTVWQNLLVAQNSPADTNSKNFLKRWFGNTNRDRAAIDGLLEFAGLGQKRDELASNLAFGEQRRLELARAVATKPVLLLLDEPAAGMNSKEVQVLRDRILHLRDEGMTILLVEHVMELVMGVTDRIAVLNFGSKIAEGTPTEIQQNLAVQEAYLGAT